MLDVFKFDMVTLSVKGLEGHSWQVAVGVNNGDGKFYLQDGVAELIKHYKLKEKFCIVFKAISESVLEILMFDKSGAEIDYGNPPIQEILQISSVDDDVTENLNNDSDSESLIIQPNFVSMMSTYDWKYKVNIPIQFAKEFLGLDDMLLTYMELVLAEDDEVDFMLDVAANDDRIIFNTVITRSG
ncbi:hypothetical protein GH714_006438 [Hevea brasiliensis]|uniref:TF-B3 domain-containing protein n=1 Tax=Hevea brasiliensis TaxID=3981 RepID=A0A6A6NFX0_HEVBR|nr:hypothetical protein GH714_006438 [Hevea brasiliensis]